MYGAKKNTLEDCVHREKVKVKGKFHSASYNIQATAEVFVSMMGKVESGLSK